MPASIMVVDDEPAITNIVCRVLRRAGHEVIEVHDGQRALQLAREVKPDLVLLDVMLPGMMGTDVARCIRTDAELQGMRIVLFSSIDEPMVDWRGAGADAFLQKVFSVVALPDLVARILHGEG